jgi:hypothetical protein
VRTLQPVALIDCHEDESTGATLRFRQHRDARNSRLVEPADTAIAAPLIGGRDTLKIAEPTKDYGEACNVFELRSMPGFRPTGPYYHASGDGMDCR